MASKLTEITTKYHTFVENQVLTENQLNEFITYFDDQDRLTRVFLNGVGLVCGFKVSKSGTKITISQGVGVTTDGDLLQLQKTQKSSPLKKLATGSLTYSMYKKFKDDAASYERFRKLSGGEEMAFEVIDLYELHPEDTDVEDVSPLSELPDLNNMVVLLYLESFADYGDLCTAIDCDNQGVAQINRLRVLLVSKADAEFIASNDVIYTNHDRFEQYFNLPEPAVKRVVLNQINTSKYEELKRAYYDAIKGSTISKTNTVTQLGQGISLIVKNFGKLLQVSISKTSLISALSKLNSYYSFSPYGVPSDIQYRYDLLKDLVDTYNELKDLLLQLKQICLPDITAFPKHLMLGLLSEINSEPKDLRHDFYPSPASGCDCKEIKKAKSLLLRLFELINNFNIKRGEIRITPSNKLPELSKRSIPFYYRLDTNFLKAWDYSKTKLFKHNYNLGYRTENLASAPQVQDPLNYNMDTFDFYRIEGHQGKDYRDVLEELDDQKKKYGLSFDVKALSVNLKSDDLDIDDYECEFEDLKVMLKAWTKEQDCILAEVASFFSAFSTKIPGANIRENELDLKKVTAFNTNFDVNYTAAVAYQPVYYKASVGTATKALYEEEVKGKAVEDNITTVEDTIGVEMIKAIEETKGGSVNDIIASASKKLEVKVDTEEWNAEPELKEFVVDKSVELMAHTYVLTQRMPVAVNLVDVSRVNDYKLSLTQLCSLVKKLKAKYRSTKLSVGLQSFTGLLINQLSTVCCSGKKLEVLLDEVNARKEQILLRLQLSKFIEQHPGLEHIAGVEPGGTLVLVYKNSKTTRDVSNVLSDTKLSRPSIPTEELMASKAMISDKIMNLESLSLTERSTVLKSATELIKYEDYTSRLREINVLDRLIPTEQIADNTVVADFALPYMCCSDCAPINYIISKPPATLRLSRNTYCLLTDTDAILYEVSPSDGEIGMNPEVSGVSIENGKISIVADNFPEEMFGQVIHFTVDNQVTDAVLTVYRGIQVDFDVPAEPTTEATHRFVPAGDLEGTGFFWEFGDGTTSTAQNPSHTYKLPVNDENKVTVRLTATAANGICKTTVEHDIVFAEIKPEISLDPDAFCASDKTEYPFKVTPEGAKVELSGDGVITNNAGGFSFVPAAAKPGTITFLLNGEDSGLSVTVHAAPVAACTPKQLENQNLLVISNDSKNASTFEWNINGSPQTTTNLDSLTINIKPDDPSEWKITLIARGADVCPADRMSTSITTKYIEETPVNTCVEETKAAILGDAKILATIKPDPDGILANILKQTRSIYGGSSDFNKGVLDRIDEFLKGEANGELEVMFPKLLNDTSGMVMELANNPELQKMALTLLELQLRLFYNILGCQDNEVIKKFADLIDSILNQILGMLKKLQGMRIIFSDTMKKFVDVYAKKVAELILLSEHMKIIIANKFI
ncbi:PKD domain-containing protein [uncultured Draconibacterium sp.]|uniref:PKD domain-containing protein n=1 Tax=uncultured Draconibacterium sp. TaxID=1573823 RepID=UPI0029C8E5A4|nr:PKD domain-containing protein [uncultured Draconibacterium sp.]